MGKRSIRTSLGLGLAFAAGLGCAAPTQAAEAETIGRWTLVKLPRDLGHVAWIPSAASAGAAEYCRGYYLGTIAWGIFSDAFLAMVRRERIACLAVSCRLHEGHTPSLDVELKLVGKTRHLGEASRTDPRGVSITLRIDRREWTVENDPGDYRTYDIRSIEGWPAGLSELYVSDELHEDAREILEEATRIESEPVEGRIADVGSLFSFDIPGFTFDATGAKEMLARMDLRCRRHAATLDVPRAGLLP